MKHNKIVIEIVFLTTDKISFVLNKIMKIMTRLD